jgi:hypothetical protein
MIWIFFFISLPGNICQQGQFILEGQFILVLPLTIDSLTTPKSESRRIKGE